MKEKFLKFIDKFYGFFEMKSFDPENKKHKKIIQKRVDKMLSSPKMVIWIKQAYWFGKDDVLTNEVLTFLIDNLGFKQIHCCNTLPVKEGGLSGKSLIPYVNNLVSIIREKWGEEIVIIAGGGITDKNDIKNYLSRGANHISLGTICFKPWKIKNLIQ